MLKLGGSSTQLQTNGNWWVNLTFNGQGTQAFGVLTTKMFAAYAGSSSNPQNEFAIVLDGAPVAPPFVAQARPAGTATIQGTFTQGQASSLANVLNYGALPLTFQEEQAQSISAQLGSSQLHAGLLAGLAGLLLVVIYAFLYYRGLGIVSVSSLAIAALLSYLAVVLLTLYHTLALSLAGVAGLVVAIGITADSFVVFFERLRDEVRDGKSLRAAVERGWQRARRTILVSDTVSFIAAAVLYKFAVSEVQNFAFTLGLTTLIDVVVVFLFTKPMITLLARTKFFGGGHRLSGLDPAPLRPPPPAGGGSQPIVQQLGLGGTSKWQVRTTPLTFAQQSKVQDAIASDLHVAGGLNNVSIELVGPSWGSQISHKALEGLIAFLVLIVIYLTIAFEWKMAVAAFVALIHDIVITTGVYALAGFQVSPATVIGLLTILGYSLYDTVVVFDKVRENTAGLLATDRSTYSQAANLALNQTLVRSINTSLIALLPVAAILVVAISFLGTGELQDLALVLFVGMLSGTYSSICIATPVLAGLNEREPQYKQLAARVARRAAGGRAAQRAARAGKAGAARRGPDTTDARGPHTAAQAPDYGYHEVAADRDPADDR